MVTIVYLGLVICLFKIVSTSVVEQCTDDIFADPDSCDHFYKCDNGKPVLFKCDSTLFYNTHSKVCDWPRNVECDVNTGRRPDSGTSGHQSSNNDYTSDDRNDKYNQGHDSSTQDKDRTPEDDSGLYYAIQSGKTLQIQDPNDAPNIQPPPPGTDFSERPRRTVDDLYSEDNNPYS